MITFAKCQEEAQLEKCVDFVLCHRREFYPAYDLGQVLTFLSVSMNQGEIITAFSEDGEILALTGYIFGTPEKKYTDKHRIRIELVCIAAEYRRTGLFLRGLKYLLNHLAQIEPDVREIEFYIPAHRYDLRNLFAKFATLTSTVQTKLGMEDLFKVTMEDLNKYCDERR